MYIPHVSSFIGRAQPPPPNFAQRKQPPFRQTHTHTKNPLDPPPLFPPLSPFPT